MTIWLYTQDDCPLRDGPFFSLEQAAASALWEWLGVCLWTEELTAGGCLYSNAIWLETGWFPTSRGYRPAEPIRPQFLIEGRAV